MANFTEDYQQLPPAVKLLLSVVICGVVSYYFYIESIEQREYTLAEKQESLQSLEAELKQISSTIITPITLEEELARANREHKKILEQLPAEASIEKILNEFASISRLTGTEIHEFMPASDKTTEPNTAQGTEPKLETDETNSNEISLKMSGTFTSVVSFLDMAMSIPRVIRMSDFELKNAEKELKLVQRPKLEFNGKFIAYFQRNAMKLTQEPEVSNASNETQNKTDEIAKEAIDLNGFINKSFSAK